MVHTGFERGGVECWRKARPRRRWPHRSLKPRRLYYAPLDLVRALERHPRLAPPTSMARHLASMLGASRIQKEPDAGKTLASGSSYSACCAATCRRTALLRHPGKRRLSPLVHVEHMFCLRCRNGEVANGAFVHRFPKKTALSPLSLVEHVSYLRCCNGEVPRGLLVRRFPS